MKINIIVYGIRNAPPPCLKQRYGNRQTLPKPEKIKVIEISYGNMLPIKMRKVEDPSAFKTMTKKWIWENIPSY